MTSFFNPKFSKDFSLILNSNDDNYDTIIQVGENENIKEFRVHSVILRSRSPYFEGAFSSSWVKKENDIIIFNKPNVTPNIFDMILRYIYSGKLDLTEKLSDILKLLVASDELLLEELCDYLREYLTKERYNWIHKDFVLVFYTVRKLANCEFLQNYCFETICFDPEFIITSFSFPSLERDMYYDLLEREDLLIKEIVAWDYLIIWGIEQTSGLRSLNCDRNKWNNEDYEALKETLNEFIPLIRFTNITFDDFNDKVRPYKNIIPNQIYKEIEEFYDKGIIPKIILPPRKIEKFDSKIIKSRLIRRIIEWINIEDFWISNYNLNLIYRGSIDGISNKSFKNKCKGQVKSLVLIKVKKSKKIIGGYSSIGFNSIEDNLLRIYEDNRRFYHSSNNFVFSFENNEDIQNMKISRVINYDKAIYDQPHNGFNFGYNAFFMTENHCIINNYSCNYENNIRTDTIYSIEEIETFIMTEL
ncbi:BTB-domain-containing protein [Rhizophagus irregularis]|uniref:BTB-domain-containing protein n=1 Tax=Rhizophagus irregularis TaxID=588596 RepID=A0A2N0SB86_9GLOM|nr:BTB-domain-containing protein [Rhizophagus irregularis]